MGTRGRGRLFGQGTQNGHSKKGHFQVGASRQLCRSWVVYRRVDVGASRRPKMTALRVGRPWPTFAAASMRRWRFAAWDRWGAHAVASKLVWSIHCAHRTAPRCRRLAERGARAGPRGSGTLCGRRSHAISRCRQLALPTRARCLRRRWRGDVAAAPGRWSQGRAGCCTAQCTHGAATFRRGVEGR